jgi:predicted negative regulator of RcsB-dependent stress response
MGNLDEALRYLMRATEQLDTDPVIFEHLGDVYFSRHERERAREQWQRALELGGDEESLRAKLDRLERKP